MIMFVISNFRRMFNAISELGRLDQELQQENDSLICNVSFHRSMSD
jgi:hypothetical protein